MTALTLRRWLPVIAVLSLLATLVPAPTAAHADGGAEATFVSQLNQERQRAGLSSLRVAGDLTAVARQHSERMAAQNDLHHNPNLGGDVSSWQKVGENVGRGPTTGDIHRAFMASPGHKANILGGDWVEVGVGVVVRDGQMWVTEIFRLPAGSAAPAAEASASEKAPPESEASTGANEAEEAQDDDADSSGQRDEPAASAEAPPAPEPEPSATPPGPRHEVEAPPAALDRLRLKLARLEAAETSLATG